MLPDLLGISSIFCFSLIWASVFFFFLLNHLISTSLYSCNSLSSDPHHLHWSFSIWLLWRKSLGILRSLHKWKILFAGVNPLFPFPWEPIRTVRISENVVINCNFLAVQKHSPLIQSSAANQIFYFLTLSVSITISGPQKHFFLTSAQYLHIRVTLKLCFVILLTYPWQVLICVMLWWMIAAGNACILSTPLHCTLA